MMWWMAGATAFMTQFSAWTFTGAAAKAYEDGISVMFIFGEMRWDFRRGGVFARRYRRLRVETAMEVIRVRFGHIRTAIHMVKLSADFDRLCYLDEWIGVFFSAVLPLRCRPPFSLWGGRHFDRRERRRVDGVCDECNSINFADRHYSSDRLYRTATL